MGEFFAVKSIPGTGGTDLTDLIKAEGYLAHKWGLTSSLPTSHIYKSFAPTDEIATPTPTPTVTATPTATVTATPTVTATVTLTPTPTPIITSTPTVVPTATISPTLTPETIFPIDNIVLVKKGEHSNSARNKFIVGYEEGHATAAFGKCSLSKDDVNLHQARDEFVSENIFFVKADPFNPGEATTFSPIKLKNEDDVKKDVKNKHTSPDLGGVKNEMQRSLNRTASILNSMVPCLNSVSFTYVPYSEVVGGGLDQSDVMVFRARPESSPHMSSRIGGVNTTAFGDPSGDPAEIYLNIDYMATLNLSTSSLQDILDNSVVSYTDENKKIKTLPVDPNFRPTCDDKKTKVVTIDGKEYLQLGLNRYRNFAKYHPHAPQGGESLLSGNGSENIGELIMHEMMHAFGVPHRISNPCEGDGDSYKSIGGVMGCHLKKGNQSFDETELGIYRDIRNVDPNEIEVEYDCATGELTGGANIDDEDDWRDEDLFPDNEDDDGFANAQSVLDCLCQQQPDDACDNRGGGFKPL